MISRVAESCFWLHRYMERAESMARLLRVTRAFLLDVEVPALERWHPVIVVSGEEHRFPEAHPAPLASNDAEVVQRYMTWDERCIVGIRTSIYWARENARTIRDVMSLEMWEAVNAFWHWLSGGKGRRLYGRDRDAFYQRVKDACALFQGICHGTMLHEEPFDFMRFGLLLERAGQTARMLDVKHHLVGPTARGAAETAVESAQWVALLRSCSAEESFYRRNPTGLSGRDVAAFLLQEESFPRSVLHCLERASNFLSRIRSEATSPRFGRDRSPGSTRNLPPQGLEAQGIRGERPEGMLASLMDGLKRRTVEEILDDGLHEELTGIIDTTAGICNAVHHDYFDPVFNETLPAAREGKEDAR